MNMRAYCNIEASENPWLWKSNYAFPWDIEERGFVEWYQARGLGER